MVHASLRELLKPYGLDTSEILSKLTPWDAGHLKKVLAGARPVSRKLALKLKELSHGALSLDQLLSAGGDGKPKRNGGGNRRGKTASQQ